MLHDQIKEYLATNTLRSFGSDFVEPYQFLVDHIAHAPRYVLDRPATMMVQALTIIKPSSLLAALPLCRLPAPAIWVEFAWKDRQDWQAEATRRGLIQPQTLDASRQPSRLGFLIRQVEHGGETMIEFNEAWNFPASDEPVQVCFKNMFIATAADSFAANPEYVNRVYEFLKSRKPEVWSEEMQRHIRDPHEIKASAALEARLYPQEAPYWRHVWNRLPPEGHAEFNKRADFDLLYEWKFVVAILALLNSRNMMKVEPVEEYGKLNKARARSGKPPLMSYQPITINLSKVQKRRLVRHALGQRKRPDEPQFVIGHLKVRKTGIFWWNHHERYGEGAKPREYKVTA